MLSLVIPFYNDSGCPIPFVRELQKYLGNIDYHLILVDDCSTDNTLQELESLKGRNVRIIHNKVNKDYGGAIMTGLNGAKGDILGFSCGDGEVSPEDIVKVYKSMGNKEAIKAVRVDRKDGFNRKIISKVFNILSKKRFRLNLEDINGYPVFFKKEVYAGLSDVRNDWLFNIDLYRKIISRGFEIHEIKVNHRTRTASASKMVTLRKMKMIVNFFRYK